MPTSFRHLRARVLKSLFSAHVAIYEASDGRLGASLGLPMLLLTTTGRKTGLARTTPLAYFEDDGRYVVVGSDGGARRDPQWWENLKVNPRAELRVGRHKVEARAELAKGEERARLWERGKRVNPAWQRYQRHTERELPVVVFNVIR